MITLTESPITESDCLRCSINSIPRACPGCPRMRKGERMEITTKDINRLITLWMGECRHEFVGDDDRCKKCGKTRSQIRTILAVRYEHLSSFDKNLNPDFSHPDHFARFTKRLFENKEMWEAFINWVRWEPRIMTPVKWPDTMVYLFQPNQLRYTRFITLFAEFLRLPETVERFGVDKQCPHFSIECDGHHKGKVTYEWCESCDGSGKVMSAWAREEEGE